MEHDTTEAQRKDAQDSIHHHRFPTGAGAPLGRRDIVTCLVCALDEKKCQEVMIASQLHFQWLLGDSVQQELRNYNEAKALTTSACT